MDKNDLVERMSRYFGLILLLTALISVPTILIREFEVMIAAPDQSSTESNPFPNYSPFSNCSLLNYSTGHGNPPGLNYDILIQRPNILILSKEFEGSSRQYQIPVYMSFDANSPSSSLIDAIIVQHGNLRNGYDYYCSALESLVSSNVDLSSKLIIAPQFLINNDTCVDSSGNVITIDAEKGLDCDYPIWSSDGWKDGHTTRNHHQLFSYEVYDMIVSHLRDKVSFPNLRTITFFGFSAGAQMILRYSLLPTQVPVSPLVHVRYVISDPSTFLYLDNRRPFTNGSLGFGIPDASWIPSSWMVSLYFSTITISLNMCRPM